MNEEYLFNITGNDPEIEKLEQKLAALRFRSHILPVIPAPTLTESNFWVERENRNWKFLKWLKIGIPTFASLILGLFALTIFLNLKSHIVLDVAVVEPVSDVQPPKAIIRNLEHPVVVAKNPLQKKKKATAIEFAVSKAKTKRSPIPVSRSIDTKILQKRETPAKELTEDEQAAYEQLKLALSITSATFKEVQEKVNGADLSAMKN